MRLLQGYEVVSHNVGRECDHVELGGMNGEMTEFLTMKAAQLKSSMR
jgi:hypothetical protein